MDRERTLIMKSIFFFAVTGLLLTASHVYSGDPAGTADIVTDSKLMDRASVVPSFPAVTLLQNQVRLLENKVAALEFQMRCTVGKSCFANCYQHSEGATCSSCQQSCDEIENLVQGWLELEREQRQERRIPFDR